MFVSVAGLCGDCLSDLLLVSLLGMLLLLLLLLLRRRVFDTAFASTTGKVFCEKAEYIKMLKEASPLAAFLLIQLEEKYAKPGIPASSSDDDQEHPPSPPPTLASESSTQEGPTLLSTILLRRDE